MKKEAIGIGEDVIKAKEDACLKLGVDPLDEKVEFEIIENSSKKVLGIFGGKKAKVKVTIKETAQEVSKDFLNTVIKLMGLDSVTVTQKETDKGIEFDVEGEDVGFVIGRRGETLDALQYLTTLATNRVDSSYKRITINTGNYREKREKTLEILGKKMALKCVKTGKKQSLEPMNPYERRIIHTAVQKVNGAISWSEGESINRHVVIGIDPKFKGKNKKSYNKNKKRNSTISKDEVPNREPLNEGQGMGLYGRIDI